MSKRAAVVELTPEEIEEARLARPVLHRPKITMSRCDGCPGVFLLLVKTSRGMLCGSCCRKAMATAVVDPETAKARIKEAEDTYRKRAQKMKGADLHMLRSGRTGL